MASRIPQQFIDDLLDRADIVEVIDRRVSLKKSGRNYMACCPFHDEKSPSFSVNQEKQFYYCFGCGAGGNAIGFLMDYERLDFPRAVEVLADAAGLEVPREATVFHQEPQQKRNIYTILEKAADYFCRQLREHPNKQRAIDYLKARGLSGEIARDFSIGYAPPGWDNLLNTLGDSEEDKQLLIDGGMLIDKPEENKCYDRFRDRIMFPIRDNRGRVIAFGGRVLGDDKPKYLNSPETPVFHKNRELYGLYQARKSNRHLTRLLVVEGYMDVVALAQCGINWSAATLGTATSTEHLKLIYRQCQEVVFCFDGDQAGLKAANRALESALPAMEDGRQARFMFLPEGEDPDSLIRQIGAGEFERRIEQSSPLEQYLFDSLCDDLDPSSLEGKARLSKRAAPLIQKLPDGVFKTLMMGSLAERTGLTQDKLTELLTPPASEPAQGSDTTYPEYRNEPANHGPSPADHSPAPIQQKPRQRPKLAANSRTSRDPVLYAIGLLLFSPKSGSKIDSFHTSQNSEPLKLLTEMIELTQKRPESSTHMLLVNWMNEPWKSIIERAMQQLEIFHQGNILVHGSTGNEEPELLDTITHIQNHYSRQALDNEIDKILSDDYANQTDEQKLRLVQLLNERHSQ